MNEVLILENDRKGYSFWVESHPLIKKMYSIPEAHQSHDFVTQDVQHPFHSIHLLNAIIVPRPIAFITSVDANGVVNAAPFSYFNVVCTDPAVISVSIEHRQGQRKDTARNIVAMREFVINICSVELARAISLAAGDFPPETSEIELAQLSLIPSCHVAVPRVANTLAQLECVLHQVVGVHDYAVDLILGAVIKVHVHKKLFDAQGRIDVQKLNPLARLAGLTFAGVDGLFEIPRGMPAKNID